MNTVQLPDVTRVCDSVEAADWSSPVIDQHMKRGGAWQSPDTNPWLVGWIRSHRRIKPLIGWLEWHHRLQLDELRSKRDTVRLSEVRGWRTVWCCGRRLCWVRWAVRWRAPPGSGRSDGPANESNASWPQTAPAQPNRHTHKQMNSWCVRTLKSIGVTIIRNNDNKIGLSKEPCGTPHTDRSIEYHRRINYLTVEKTVENWDKKTLQRQTEEGC